MDKKQVLHSLLIVGFFMLGKVLHQKLGINFIWGVLYCAICIEILRRIEVK